MNIYINDPELIKRIKATAKKMHRSVSYVIVEVLRHAFRKAQVGGVKKPAEKVDPRKVSILESSQAS